MYCTSASFEARFGSKELAELLPEDDGREYSPVAQDADALIDSYLAARYALPLSKTFALIRAIAADLMRYELYDEAPPKEVTERRKLALEQLEMLRDGELVLPGATAAADAGGVLVSAPAISFDSCDQKDYMGKLGG